MDVQGLFLAYFSALVALILPSWLHHISRKSQPIKRANMSKVQQFPGTALILLFNHQRKGTKSERWQFLRQFPPQQQGVIFGIFYVTFLPVHCAVVRCAKLNICAYLKRFTVKLVEWMWTAMELKVNDVISVLHLHNKQRTNWKQQI